jgi:hypothetical protein
MSTITAYEKWMHSNALQYVDTNDQQLFIAQQLHQDCLQQNPMAFDLVDEVGDDGFTQETFIKAAQLILNKFTTND